MAGVTERQWQAYETGGTTPRPGKMLKIVKAFDLPTDFFSYPEGPPRVDRLDRIEGELQEISKAVRDFKAVLRVLGGTASAIDDGAKPSDTSQHQLIEPQHS